MEHITVEVAYALQQHQHLISVRLPRGSSAAEAVECSGLLQQCPELGSGALTLGVFGRRCAAATPLNDGDRVEVYRQLVIDPKTRRRRRAKGGA